MRVKAVVKDTGVSARKIRPLISNVRGMRAIQAVDLLGFMPTPHARVIVKVIRSAMANAEHNFQMEPADLKVVAIYADEARMNKRYKAKSRGRAGAILKRSSHITVVVSEQEA
ncbi:MAG: 50S ribosomal protein L22 [Dehalococcoidales bacterium]|jgi:large subunit ribosomal protein L22|nr:50S ribosomal protein L22 [Dehalococcoidales bacterium]MDD3264468.1 50S ribosomal protein L22 [Dehalococcoidales bacterium]MDD4321999.1 50S ribosomal protein L22 [Dehalococcoidales bacterium]MDD4793908.1 50S ribosomal protein L22 [Dehalococcoidales bacterium]MDD5122086.1 50S ribosomal protein L22 [Dehalococcoidales bacterium]